MLGRWEEGSVRKVGGRSGVLERWEGSVRKVGEGRKC